MADASVEYIAASVNRFHHAASNEPTGGSLIAYGSGKFVALWDTEVRRILSGHQRKDSHHGRSSQDSFDRGVLSTLMGHTGSVTCVKFMEGLDGRLLTADDTGKLILWKRDEGNKVCYLLIPSEYFN